MTIVTKEFEFYDNGCVPVVHEVGEEVEGDIEAYAVSQGFADAPVEAPLVDNDHVEEGCEQFTEVADERPVAPAGKKVK